jgi:hypothetical protein
MDTLETYQRRPSRRRLGVAGNMCFSFFQIDSLVFSRSLELARSVSQRFASLRWWPGRDGFSGARMLAWRWWICRSFLTSSMRGDGSWSKRAREHPSVDVPQRHVPCCVQRACSSTHKASLAMVFSWMWQWWRLGFPSGVHLGGTRVGRWPLASVVPRNFRDRFVFLDLLWFFLQSF